LIGQNIVNTDQSFDKEYDTGVIVKGPKLLSVKNIVSTDQSFMFSKLEVSESIADRP